MTKEEFEKMYAKNSKMSIEELKTYGFKIIPCDCDYEGCLGWQATFEMDTSSSDVKQTAP
jgi:hypothetical protein